MLFKYVLRLGVLAVLGATSSLWAYAGTGGTPLGGMGTGYVTFNAQTGSLAFVGKVMPPASVEQNEFTSYGSSSCGFHFFVKNNGTITYKQKASTMKEDAKVPVYYDTFPNLGGVNLTLTAFGPYIPGDAPLYAQLAQSPLAYFDVAAKNTNSGAVDIAAALEFSNITSGNTNLMGGANIGTSDGSNAITWAGDTNSGNAYMMVGSDQVTDTVSSGSMGAFLTTTGFLTSGAGNLVADKIHVAAGATVHFRFLMSWWNPWVNAAKGPEQHYYHNWYANSKAAGVFGWPYFAQVEAGATSIVNRVMASNFPYWYKDRLLNDLYPMVHNTVMAKDGRVGIWEGAYPIIGTIDQTEHAAVWYNYIWPSIFWRELKFWATSSHVASEGGNLLGQVHHDFNGCASGSWNYNSSDSNHFMDGWHNTTHNDYWYQPNTTGWADLNCMFIFKAYELMLASAHKDSLQEYWDSLKNTATRLAYMSTTASGYGSGYLPNQAYSSYDNTGVPDGNYCSSTALAAWEALIAMAQWLGDTASANKYTAFYNSARAQFPSTCFNSNFATGSNYSEGDVAGYSWAHYFCLPAIFDTNIVNASNSRLYANYANLSGIRDRLGKWHFYTYDHWGGFAISSGLPNTGILVNYWDWQYYFPGNPPYVFWQDLEADNNNFASYSTAPDVWRGYFQMTGTLIDNANHRLWIRPSIPDTAADSMAHVLTNCPLINPNGWGTLNYTDKISTVDNCYQNMTVSFDSALTFNQIILKNNTTVDTPGVLVRINGSTVTGVTVTTDTLASPLEKVIKLTFNPAITIQQGVQIKVFNGAVGVRGVVKAAMHQNVLALVSGIIGANSPIRFAVASSGAVKMELFAVNGARIGTIMNEYASAGSHNYVWNGRTSQGSWVGSGVAVLRLTSAGKSVSRTVSINK